MSKQILTSLSRERRGLTTRMVANIVPEFDLLCIRVTLSLLKRRGLLYIDGALCCEHCYAEDACWRITEQGRIYLRYKTLGEAA